VDLAQRMELQKVQPEESGLRLSGPLGEVPVVPHA
jgi:hypothetical protein